MSDRHRKLVVRHHPEPDESPLPNDPYQTALAALSVLRGELRKMKVDYPSTLRPITVEDFLRSYLDLTARMIENQREMAERGLL